MRIGITGATGFIGTALTTAARARGHQIVAFSRRKNIVLPLVSEVRPYDSLHPEMIDASGLDVLIHLAGEKVLGLWTQRKKERIRESRVESTRGIVDALKNCAQRPKMFICASGTGAYGHRGDEVLTETSSRGSGFLADVCAEWEAAACRAMPMGVNVALLRTGMVLGREGGAWPLLRRVFKLRIGSRLGNGKQWVPWIHLDDEIGIILDAAEKNISGPINLCSPNPVTNAEFTRKIAAALKTSTFPPVPAFMLRLLLGEMASVVLDSQRVQPKVMLSHGYTFKHPALDGALAACS
jgi:uncharacterized protein (TIGR01777 family)